MLDLIPAEAAVIVCQADRAALDGFPVARGRVQARVAPDELWLVGPRELRGSLADEARGRLGSDGLVLDQSDGWAVWSLEGDRMLDVLRRLMFAAVPDHRPAWVQGAISGVPGKVWFESNRIHLFVPAPVGHHLIDRILAVSADLAPSVREPAALALGAGR